MTDLTLGPPPDRAAAVLVMLHGRAQSPEMIRSQAAGLLRPDLHCVLPAAPGGAWYPKRFLAPLAENEPDLSASLARVGDILERLEGQGVPPGRLVLLGFSQGACLAAEAALRFPRRFGAVIVWTGALIGPPGTAWPRPEALRDVPVLLTGSDVDEWVPEASVRQTGAHLSALGAAVDLRLYPGRPHDVSAPEVAAAAALVAAVTQASG